MVEPTTRPWAMVGPGRRHCCRRPKKARLLNWLGIGEALIGVDDVESAFGMQRPMMGPMGWLNVEVFVPQNSTPFAYCFPTMNGSWRPHTISDDLSKSRKSHHRISRMDTNASSPVEESTVLGTLMWVKTEGAPKNDGGLTSPGSGLQASIL